MPPKIRTLANTILKNPAQVNIAISKPAEGILQQAYMVYDKQKLNLIKKILKEGNYASVLIFASTREHVKELDRELRHSGITAKAFHSDLVQDEREEIMRAFKSRRLPVIIGTDVLSRGIDVEGIDLVVNMTYLLILKTIYIVLGAQHVLLLRVLQSHLSMIKTNTSFQG